MANKIILKINGTALNLTNDSFKESFSSVDNINTSEAGTTLRSVTRTGIPSRSFSFKCTETDKILLDGYSKLSRVTATLFNEAAGTNKTWECFISNYSSDLIIEDGSHRYYKVSFKLNDLGEDEEES